MCIAIFLFLLLNCICVNCVPLCCQGENVINDNKTCLDGSNILSLSCDFTTIIEPPQLEIDFDTDTISVTYDEAEGYYVVEDDKYCITQKYKNGTDVAIVCITVETTVEINDTEIYYDNEGDAFNIIKPICAFITEVFLLAVIIVYLFVPDLRDIEGKCILNLVVTLFIAYLAIILAPLVKHFEPSSCNTISFLFHILIVCSYNWLSVLSFHLWRITIRPIFRSHMNWYLIYLCYGYGISLIVLVTALAIHHSHNKKLQVSETRQCWVDEGFVVWNYLATPLMLMLVASIILQVWAGVMVWVFSTRNWAQSVVRLRKKTVVYGHLLLIMGQALLSEMILFVSLLPTTQTGLLMDLNDCRNYLLGGATFFVLVPLRNKVLKALAKHGLFSWNFPEKWNDLVDEEREEGNCDEAKLTRQSSSL